MGFSLNCAGLSVMNLFYGLDKTARPHARLGEMAVQT